MADFIKQRGTLNTSRATHESARLQLLAVNERLRLLEQKRATLDRKINPDNQRYLLEKENLEQSISKLQEEKNAKENVLQGLKVEIDQVLIDYKSLTDPRVQLPKYFSNTTPFLLFPVRIETRFKTVADPLSRREIPQLWVRIYPDTCMVDSFDPQLSTQELRNAARFWAEFYAAGQIPDETNPDPTTLERQKAAWAFLAKLEGAGRAAWIAQSEEAKPLPGSVFPLRNSDKTIILTIATEDDSILADQVAIFTFFKALWLAGKDAIKIDAAKATLANADDVIEKFLPVNFNEPLPYGLKREDADLQVALVLLPDSFNATGKTNSWSQAAHVSIGPERFMLLGYKNNTLVIEELGNFISSPLQVGFDPNNTAANNFSPTESGDLEIPAELKWIIDFNEAVEKGMGFRVNLDANTRNGVDRLFVIGLRLSADEKEDGGQKLLHELFDHHYYSTKGLSVVPQGTPTNNTDKESVRPAGIDDPDYTFDRYFKQKPAYTTATDWQVKQDGEWLAEWLGMENAFFQKLAHAEGRDQADALNMNLALWPGTLGYAMDAMMKPVFGASTIDITHQFFSMFVSGRGTVPAIRIGNQPYGILPVTAFNRQRWMYPTVQGERPVSYRFNFGGMPTLHTAFIQGMYELLLKVASDWREFLVPKVPHVSAENSTHTHQQLLDIIALHPNSVEFYKRYMQTLEMLYSCASFLFPYEQVKFGFDKMEFGRAYQLLIDLGHDPDSAEGFGEFPLLSKLYGLDDQWEHKVIIDTVPLSESASIRSYTTDNRNYITALIDAAATSLDALRTNKGLSEKPSALLFSFLKFALEQGYFDTAVRLHEAADVFTPQQAKAVRTEQPFLHMQWEERMVESRYALLYKNEAKISATMSVADRVSELMINPAALRLISPGAEQQLNAMRLLENASTARLERAFVEHLDTCSYRLDAWQQALTKLQLMLMRQNQPEMDDDGIAPQKGIYLGAFGWLENVKPDTSKILTPVTPEKELVKDFTQQYMTDQANAGFIHAPSVNQAVTSAVLRNAYLANGKADNNSALAVNLSSERIRLALTVIEGIQNGQSLAALLGYKFERMLRDQPNLVNKGIDTFIYALRKRFPLNANRILDTQIENDPSVDPDTIPITAVEARNTVHGKNLIDHVRKQTGSNTSYPFGFPPEKLLAADTIITTAINEAVAFIMNIEDAIADLGMAESVHQICQGNYDRAAGVLDSYSKGSYPQTPDVIRTPRSGPTLMHRVGIPLTFIATVPYDTLHPRQSAEPSLNAWLAAMLPDMSKIICYYKYLDRTDDIIKKESLTMTQLGLLPIDLLYLLNTTGQAALSEMDERVLQFVHQNKTPRLDKDIELEYITRPADPTVFSVFEVMSLVKSLRELVLQSAPLKPTDMHLATEASTHTEIIIALDRIRVDAVINDLDSILDGDFTTLVLDVLNPLPSVPTDAEKLAILSNADQYMSALITQLHRLTGFGIPQTGIGNLYRTRQEIIISLRTKVQEVIDLLEKRAAEYTALAAAYDPLAEDAIAQLQQMESRISTLYSNLDTINLPDIQLKKAQFDAKLVSLTNLLQGSAITSMFSFLQNIGLAFNDLSDFTLEKYDLTGPAERIVQFVLNDLRPRAQGIYTLGKKATQAAADALVDLDTLAPEARAKQIEVSAKAIFGKEFRVIPRYELDSQQQFELDNAWNSPALLNYLKTIHDPPFLDPEEDWLHGVARVRDKIHHAENCLFLREALSLNESRFDIHPVQLPFKSDKYHWLAMPFPAEMKLEDGDVLLYTALTDAGATSPQYACGLLIDEWTEVIPLEKETTGLSFHYDRPNAEAPQTMLLVTPTKLTGNWEWDDIIDALHHALDSARLRAVEPYHIDQSVYARYLPPLLSPVTRHPITMGMYLAELPLMAVKLQ